MYDAFRVSGIYGIGLRRCSWLVALTFLIGAIAVPAASHASADFTFISDPAQPSLPLGSTLAGVADLTGGTVPDLILLDGETRSVGVMLGNGAGGFGAPSWFAVAGGPSAVGVADFNSDGNPDLLVSLEPLVPPSNHGAEPDMVQILFGNGQGGFTAGPVIDLPEAGAAYVGDFTGNGDEDLVVAPNDCTAGGNYKKYYMLLGNGHGELTPGPVYESPRSGGCYTLVGDFTGSGRDDLVTKPESPGEEEAIVVLPGEPDGSFGSPILTPTPQFTTHSSFLAGAADLDGEGKLGLVLRSFAEPMGQVEVFKGNGDGGFSEVGAFMSEQSRFSFWVALGDFGGNGDVDVVTVGSQLSVLANNGFGVLSPAFTATLATALTSAYVADVNGDDRPDIIVAGSTLQIFLNEPAAPIVGQPIAAPTAQPIAPSLQNVRESARRWREGRATRKLRGVKTLPNHTTFSFSLNEQATVNFSFTQRTAGRSVDGKCAAKSARNTDHKACERTTADGTLSFTGHSGSNNAIFAGHISRLEKLKPGSYTVTVMATNTAGHSGPARLGFTVLT
jgi:hypothetical protein